MIHSLLLREYRSRDSQQWERLINSHRYYYTGYIYHTGELVWDLTVHELSQRKITTLHIAVGELLIDSRTVTDEALLRATQWFT